MSRDNRNWGLGAQARVRLGGNVTVRRLRTGTSRGDLGRRAAVPTARLARIEEGKAGSTLDVWVRIAGALGVSLDDLLAGVGWSPRDTEAGSDQGSYVHPA